MPELECPLCQHQDTDGIGCRHLKRMTGTIRSFLSAFQQKHPQVQLGETSLQQKLNIIFGKNLHLPNHEESEKALADFLDHLSWEDLCLSTACDSGDPHAWRIFHERFQPLIERAAKAAAGSLAEGIEIASTLLSDLFLPATLSNEKSSSKISQYHGLGSLEGWLKVLISRMAIDRVRSQRRQTSLEDLPQDPIQPDSYQSVLRMVQSAETRQAVRLFRLSIQEVLSTLSTREKLLLKFYFFEKITLKQIGEIVKVHESTVSRLIDRLKMRIRKEVERTLCQKHQVRPNELLDLIETGLSNADLDFNRLLTLSKEDQWIKDG
jgi:RNA polymerase sigma-70 factor (ECF subfamily)